MAIFIGIDPGDYTGFAVWDSSAKAFVSVQTLPLWKALDEVKRWRYKCQMSPAYVGIKVVFEDARQRKWFDTVLPPVPEKEGSSTRISKKPSALPPHPQLKWNLPSS